MPSEVVDGMDVLAVREAASRSVERARDRSTPTLLEARTYRFMGHSMSDPIHGHYRSREEVEHQKARDPIPALAGLLTEQGLLDAAGLRTLEAEVAAEVEDAVHFAEESPDPAPEELLRHVYRS
jgi:TPP-dependent pyruvate/acetoin dehydrogenase alpha subunit